MKARDYINHLFSFEGAVGWELDLSLWKNEIKACEPVEIGKKVDFFIRKREDLLSQNGKDLFTTWLVQFGEINEQYLEKLYSCRELYSKADFQVWYWSIFKRYLFILDNLKECDNYYKYKGIASTFKDYIEGANDEILIRLISTDDEFASSAKWTGRKADAIRFAEHFGISLKRMNKTFSADFNSKHLGTTLYKDDDRRGILTILDRFK